MRFKSAMHDLFNQGFLDGCCDWISWIESPMVYDGALFVKREGF